MKATPGKLETRLILPSQLGRHALATLYIEYANTGETPISAPIIQLASADPDDSDKPLLTLEKDRLSSGFWTSSLPQGFAHSVSFLASGTQPGVINPGETIRVPVYYAGLQQPWDFSDNQVELATTILSGSDTRPMNWEGMSYVTATYGRDWTIADIATNAPLMRAMASGRGSTVDTPPPRLFVIPWVNGAPLTSEQLEQRYRIGGITKREEVPGVLQMRPDTVSADAWSAIVTNMRASVGETLGDYVRTIAQDAVYLSRQGIASNNINDLWSFEILKNSASLGPGTVLASSTDAAMATPGMSLALSRRFDNTIAGRYAAGRFGQGWVSTWDAVIKTAADGSVTIGSNGGGGVRYEPDSRTEGGYFSMLGDTSTLRKVAGVFALTATDGTVTRFDTQGRVASVTDRLGNAVTAGYDSQSRLIKLTHSCGSTLSLAYNTADRVASVTDSAGRVTTYAYDPTNAYLLSVTDSDGLATAYTYQTDGIAAQQHAMTSISAANVTRSFSYDPQGRLTATYLGKDIDRVTYTYDSGTVAVSDSAGKTTLSYDAAGRVVKVVDPLGDLSRSIYDSLGRLTASVAATGDTQTFSWDKSNRLTSLTDELGFTTTFSYGGPFGQLGSLKDARGNAIRYTRDPQGNLLTTTYADGSSETLAGYTVAGLAGTFTNRRGQATSLTYTATGQVDVETLAGGSKVDFDYDARGNLDRLTEISPLGDNKVTDYQYDYATSGDRLTRVVYPDGRFVAYAYDAFGRRSSTTDSTGAVTTYSYDTEGRLWKLADAGGGMLAEYAYDVSGRLSQVTKGNGTFTTYGYDAAGQLIHLVNYAPGGSGSTGVNSRFDYTYDSKGRRTAMHTLDGDWTYGYDATNQLTTAVFTSANLAIASQDLRYDYDAVGNRTRTTINGVVTEYVTNAMNQYTSVGGVAQSYDANGNLTFDGVNTFTYDVHNRVARVSGPQGVSEYEYDALGNRIAATVNGVRTEYLFDPFSAAGAVAEFAADGSVLRSTKQAGGLIASMTPTSTDYFDFDVLGSVVGVTSAEGTLQRQSLYDPFGKVLINVGGDTGDLGFVAQLGSRLFRGNVFMGARSYSPDTGRFLQVDPIGFGGMDINLYRYVANSPVGLIDPSGLVTEKAAAETMQSRWEWFDGIKTGAEVGAKYGDALRNGDSKALAKAGLETIYTTIGAELGAVGGAILVGSAAATLSGAGAVIAAGMIGGMAGQILADRDWNSGWLQNKLDQLDRLIPDIPDSWLPNPAAQFPPGVIRPPALPPSGPPGGAGTAGSVDPNEKLSVNGFGAERAIRGDTTIPYRINFENIGPGSIDPHTNQKYTTFATAPAQRVTVVDQLSSTLDWSTFRLTEMGFGDTIVTIPANSTSYEGIVSISYGGTSFVVELSAGISLATGRVSATFQSIDPQTNLPPDVLVGFLPPEDGNGIGKGFFSFTIRPRADLPTGTVLKNVALISFDGQGIIATNQSNPFDPQSADPNDPILNALNTIDNSPPAALSFAPNPAARPGSGFFDIGGLEDGAAWEWSADGGNNWNRGYEQSFSLAVGTYAAGGVKVRQTDGVGWTGPAGANAVAITVAPPNQAPTALTLAPATIAENSPVGTAVGSFATTDPDSGDSFRYALVSGEGDGDNGLFVTVGGVLRTTATLNFEARSRYSIRVRTTDTGGLSTERSLAITVADVLEPLAIDHVETPATGMYRAGDVLSFTLVLTRQALVTGKPEIPLTVGTTLTKAVYQSGSGTSRLVFNYVVKAKDADTDGVVLASAVRLPPGAKIRLDATSLPLTFPTVVTQGVRVDTAPPLVKTVVGPAAGNYRAGQVLRFAVTTSESVIVSGVPALPMVIGSTTRQAVFDATTSTPTLLVFNYTVQSGDIDANGITVGKALATASGSSIQDAAGNRILASIKPPATAKVIVDTAAPKAVTVKAPVPKTYLEGQSIDVVMTFNEPVRVFGTPGLPITIGTAARIAAFAGFAAGSGGRSLLFRSAVRAGDLDGDGITVGSSLELGGATILDAAGNAAVLTIPPNDMRKVLVDAVAPSIVSLSAPSLDSKGTRLMLRVEFSEPVIVTGRPILPFTLGGSARQFAYSTGSKGRVLELSYSAKPADDMKLPVVVGNSLLLAGGKIRDAAGNAPAMLVLPLKPS